MYLTLKEFIEKLNKIEISDERKKILLPLAKHINKKLEAKEPVAINFICTHNSRRSHLGQIWAHTLANYFGLNNVTCFSGGTVATAMYPQIVETLKSVGFSVLKLSETDNAFYALKTSGNAIPILSFSKEYNHPYNPSNDFIAIMTCGQADEDCPLVNGAEARYAVTYEDPKVFDNSTKKAEMYAKRNLQIASEMYFVFKMAQK